MHRKGRTYTYTCRSCVYYEECGDPSRTEECQGRTTKKQLSRIDGQNIAYVSKKIAEVVSDIGCYDLDMFMVRSKMSSASFKEWVITLVGSPWGIDDKYISRVIHRVNYNLTKMRKEK